MSTASLHRTIPATARNLITGCGVLGFGFDIFGEYGEDSVLRPLLDLGGPGAEWTSPADITYDVPDNVSLSPATGTTGAAYAFANKENFLEHFAVKANVKGSYGAFSGEFEASFSTDTSSETEYTYGLYEERVDAWSLTMHDASSDALTAAVRRDPDFTALPHHYTRANQHLFFRFFAKYGTHYISRVSCGARMSYTVAVSKKYVSSTTEAAAKLSAEFGGVFGDASGSAEADFKRAGQQWFDNRQVTVRTVGGDTSLLAGIAPAYEVNNNAPFEKWLTSAERIPAPIAFQLSAVSTLFSGDQAAAVSTAYSAYANSRLYAESRYDGYTLLMSGTPLEPKGKNFRPGFTLAVIDLSDLNVPLLKYYNTVGWPPSVPYFETMAEDLAPYVGNKQFVLVAVANGWFSNEYFDDRMVTLLKSAGAGAGLEEFHRTYSGPMIGVAYVLVGVMGSGPGMGVEAFRHGGGTTQAPAVASALLLPSVAENNEDEFRFQLVSM